MVIFVFQINLLIVVLFIVLENGNNISMRCSLWNLPENVQSPISSENDSTRSSLTYVCDLPVDCTLNAIFEPSNSNSSIVSISENCVYYFDCNTDVPRVNILIMI
jgi:hypothetical protein